MADATAPAGGGSAFPATIRTATPADLDGIMVIERANFPDDAWSRETMASELVNPNGRYLVALDGHEVIAYAGLRAAGDQADVQTIAVRADRRRGGIGRALLLELLDEARRRGAESVFLEVRADNAPAQTLYAGLGFIAFTIRSGYYPGGVDAVVMQKVLS